MLCSTIAPAKASPAINVQGKRRRTSGQEEARAFTTSNVDAFCANSADDKPPDTASSAHMAAAESWYDQADMAILTQEYSSPEVVRPAVSQSHRRTWPTEGAQRLAYGRDLAKISNAPRSGHRSSSRAPDGPPPKRDAPGWSAGRARIFPRSRFTPPASSASVARSTHRRTPRTSTGSSRCSRCASS